MANAPLTPTKPQRDQSCPCGSGKLFGDCCEPVISGARLAVTAEQLMRARFTAHVTYDTLFLHRTYRPTSKQKFIQDPEGTDAPVEKNSWCMHTTSAPTRTRRT